MLINGAMYSPGTGQLIWIWYLGYMSYYYIKLWDHKKHAMRAMTAVFTLTYIPAIVITIISALAFRSEHNTISFTVVPPNLWLQN